MWNWNCNISPSEGMDVKKGFKNNKYGFGAEILSLLTCSTNSILVICNNPSLQRPMQLPFSLLFTPLLEMEPLVLLLRYQWKLISWWPGSLQSISSNFDFLWSEGNDGPTIYSTKSTTGLQRVICKTWLEFWPQTFKKELTLSSECEETAADHLCWHANQLASARGNSPVDPRSFSWEIYISQALYDLNVMNNLHKLTKFQERKYS